MKKGIKVVLTAILILFVFATIVIAGGESIPESTLGALNQTIDTSGPYGMNLYTVMLFFFSLWLLLIGLMCHHLEKIPGVYAERKSGK